MTIQEILIYNGITSIWHFTDRSNITSIIKNGILSFDNILKQNIKVSRYGASDSSHIQDVQKGLDKFVHLSFIKDHPMYHVAKAASRITNPVWLEIDLSVLTNENTLFSNMLANTINAPIFDSMYIEKMIDFKTILYGDSFNDRKEARKAEIMIYNKIGIDKIKGIHNGC